jgi:hypothetical protein
MLRKRTLRSAAAGLAILVALVAASSAVAAKPTVTINQAAGQIDPTPGSTVQFTATFSAEVTDFDGADVLVSGSAGAVSANVTGTGSVYTVSVSGMSTPGLVVASIPAGAATVGGEESLASTSTDNQVTWYSDTTPPTVMIDTAAAQADPTSAAPVFFTARFSEPVTGFDAADVVLGGSSAGGALTATVTGGPTDYDVAVGGMTSAGTVVATIPAGAALDFAGNASLASTSTDNSVSWAPPLASGGGGSGDNGGGGAPTTTPTIAPPPVTPKPSLRLLSKCSAKHPCPTGRGGRVLPLRVACGPASPCVGKLLIAAEHKSLGKLTFHLAAGAKTTLRVPLLHRATRLLAARPEISAELEIRLGGHSISRRLSLA